MIGMLELAKQQEAADEALSAAEVGKQKALALPCDTPEEYEAITVLMVDIKNHVKNVESTRKELKAPVLEAGRRIDGLFKPALSMLAEVQKILKTQKAGPYLQKQAIEKQRAEAEANRLAQKERDRLEKLAVKAVNRGDEKKAEEFMDRSEAVATEVVIEEPDKGPVHTRQVWKAVVENKQALCEAVGKGDVADVYVDVNQRQLDLLARSTQGNGKVPGVRFYSEETLVVK
jgi:hypothetical protein